jgi:hypothetical protein
VIRIAEAADCDEEERERAYDVLANLAGESSTDRGTLLNQAKARLRKEEAEGGGA